MERKTIVKQGRSVALAACALLIGASVMQSCKDDDLILTGQPDWLGNSIYERLQEDGNYKTMLRLIDDLGQKEVLSHTGSKTLFVASDSAFNAWFGSNKWGVKSYDELSDAKKKMLLKNAMINNAYLLELMSNGKAQGDAATPEWGRTMRRESSVEIYDSVYVMPLDSMPKVKYWDYLRQRGKAVPLFKDATKPTMIHFLPAYMENNNITAEDLKVLTNGRASSLNEAWVNGMQVLNSGDPNRKKIDYDITCKNGYIHKVDGVIESSPNMAEIIRQDASTSIWSHLLDRFSAPYFYEVGTREYDRIYNTEDSAFVLRYFSQRCYDHKTGRIVNYSNKNTDKPTDPEGNLVYAYLKYDPAWNQYIDNNSKNDNDVHYDAGVMIVPTNKAILDWWNGSGKELQDEYKEMDSIPDDIIAKLINVNMLTTFSEAVPSKFDMVLNDAKESLGIKASDVIGTYMGCNGVVYKTNKVFTPAEFSSVAYPALAHVSNMNIIYRGGIDARGFLPYLLSMDSKYALLLPTNGALLNYVDQGSYGKTTKMEIDGDSVAVETPDIFEFKWDLTSKSVKASRYEGQVDADGNITKGTRKQLQVADNVINTVFDGMMDQLIIVIPDKSMTVEDYVKAGYNYFKTKGGAIIRASYEGDSLCFEGGWQMEHNGRKITSVQRYDKQNGNSYQLESQCPMGAQSTVYLTLQAHPEFQGFLNILKNDYCDLLATTIKGSTTYYAGQTAQGSENLRILDNYNYTVYVPTNEAIKKLQDEKKLPTDEELSRGEFSEVTEEEPAVDSMCVAEGWYQYNSDQKKVRKAVIEAIRGIVNDFVRYHVQDNSVAIGLAKAPNSPTSFESMKRNPNTGRYYPIKAVYDNTSLTVTDAFGKPHQVLKDKNLYNKICREYWFETKPYTNTSRMFMASNVVLHQIDGAMCYGYKYADGKTVDMRPWREVVVEALKALK